MTQDVAELKEKLKSLRAENRRINLKNIVMRSDLADLKQQVKYYEDRKASLTEEIESLKKKTFDDLAQDASRKEKLRIERRKAILLDIKSFTEENRILMDKIKEIGESIDNFNVKRKISSKVKRRKKSPGKTYSPRTASPKPTPYIPSSVLKK